MIKKDSITFINLNMMYGNVKGTIDQQAYIPLGLLYIASVLEKKGYGVILKDYQLSKAKHPFILKNFLSFIGQISTKIVGFSCMSNLLPFTILAAKMIKENYLDKRYRMELSFDKAIKILGFKPLSSFDDVLERIIHDSFGKQINDK